MTSYLLLNSLAGGGAERVAVNLFKALNFEKIFLLEKEVKYEVSPEKIHCLSNHTTSTNPIYKTLYIPIYALKLSRYLKNHDIVLSLLERANYVNILASLFTKHKAIASVHMSQIQGREKYHPYNLISRILYPKASLVVAVSKGVAKELEKFFGIPKEKIKIIYNPIDLEEIQKKTKEELREYKEIFEFPVLISVGRLTKQKGQWYLLRIFRELKKDFPELKLVILGDGELKDYLVNLSKNLDFETFVWGKDKFSKNFNVYFLGFQKNPFKFMSRSKIFVLTSLWEGFSYALVEALACGIPVVSSDCESGPREILAPNTDFNFQTRKPEFAEYGILMPNFEKKLKRAKDPLTKIEEIWVKTLKEFLKNENLRKEYSEKAKLRAKDFSVEKIVPQWLKILS